MVAQEELRPAFQHNPLALVHVVGQKPDGHRRDRRTEALNPGGEEDERQGVGRRKGQRRGRSTLLVQIVPKSLQPAGDVPGGLQNDLAGGRQSQAMGLAIHEGRTAGVFERSDAPTKGRLSDMPPFGRAREV